MPDNFFDKVNRAYATTDSTVTNVALTFDVTTETGYNALPAGLHTIQVGDDTQGYEIMMATRAGATLTVTRAQEGTGALPFLAGTDVKLVITAAQIVELETAINIRVEQAASSTDNAIARFDGVDGDLVQNSQTTVDDNGAIKVSGGANSVIAFEGESGHANNYCAWSLGRTSAEFQGAVIHSANSWYNPSSVGDGVISVLDNTKSLRLGVGSGVAQLTIDNTTAAFSGSLTLGLGAANQDYLFTNRSTSQLIIQAQSSGITTGVELYTKDSDGTDTMALAIYGDTAGAGPADITDRERLILRWPAGGSQYQIYTEKAGTGTLRPLAIYTDGNVNQFLLAIDGTISTASDFTCNGDLELANTGTFLRGTFAISHAVTWDGGSPQACATVADGYVVVDVYIEVTTTFDGDAVITVGDGGTADGFLTDAGITQGAAAYYGQDVSARGAYIANGDRKIYTGADTVDFFITETTATQGAATVYTVIQRLK